MIVRRDQVLVLGLEDLHCRDRRFKVARFVMIYQSLYVFQESG